MATSTIWGTAQSVDHLCRGVRVVSTASHGGMLVSKGFAEKHIPKEVLEHTPFQSDCYQFEEDSEISVPMFFVPELVVRLVEEFYHSEEKRSEMMEGHFRFTYQDVLRYHPQYIERYTESEEKFKLFAMKTLHFSREQVDTLLKEGL